MDCSLPGCSVHVISQTRILEWVAISFAMGSSWPRDQTQMSCTTRGFFMDKPPRKPMHACILSRFSCVWLFATPWTLVYQAPLTMGFFRQEYWWVAMPSRGSSQPRDWTCVSCIAGGFFITEPPGKPREAHSQSLIWMPSWIISIHVFVRFFKWVELISA